MIVIKEKKSVKYFMFTKVNVFRIYYETDILFLLFSKLNIGFLRNNLCIRYNH